MAFTFICHINFGCVTQLDSMNFDLVEGSKCHAFLQSKATL